MNATFSLIVVLTAVMATILAVPALALALALAVSRGKPYTAREFSEAMERICDGVEDLWRVQDGAMFAGWEAPARARENDAVRLLCSRMLEDMRRNTVYILERAEPCCPDVLRHGRRWPIDQEDQERAEINHNVIGHDAPERLAAGIVRRGTRLVFILRLRQAQLRLPFRRDNDALCALTAEAAEQYAGLWSEVVRFIEVRFPERLSRPAEAGLDSSMAGSCRRSAPRR
jgi:hypothetical protein